MNRREAIGAVMGVVAAVAFGLGALSARRARKIGCMTIDGWRAHLRLTGEHLLVFVDGVDVTDVCYEADDILGYALVFCRDRQAHQDWTARDAMHLGADGDSVCKLRLTGRVEFRVKT